MGAELFHCQVRDGAGWVQYALITEQRSLSLSFSSPFFMWKYKEKIAKQRSDKSEWETISNLNCCKIVRLITSSYSRLPPLHTPPQEE